MSLEQFQEALKESTFALKVIKKYEDIPSELPLLRDVWIKSNTHLGQRKLLLNEMAFYNQMPKVATTIVYSGSAPGEHTPFILKHYPHIRFIFIDPNYHFMNLPPHLIEYVYKKEGVDEYSMKYNDANNERAKNIKGMTDLMNDIKCGNERVNVYTNPAFGNIDNLLVMNTKTNTRVFIIQDFITPQLALDIKARVKVDYYISDLRIMNNDMGILYDNALQLLVHKNFGVMSCLKFVLPKYQNRSILAEWMMPVFDECKNAGIDFLGEYQSNALAAFDTQGHQSTPFYNYLQGEVFVQPWARNMSGETRLWLQPDAQMGAYDVFEWRRKFNYHNFYRAIITSLPNIKSTPYYCLCSDCLLEQSIIKEFLVNKKIRLTWTNILKIKSEIDNVTYYGLKNHLSKRNQATIIYETYDQKFVYKKRIG